MAEHEHVELFIFSEPIGTSEDAENSRSDEEGENNEHSARSEESSDEYDSDEYDTDEDVLISELEDDSDITEESSDEYDSDEYDPDEDVLISDLAMRKWIKEKIKWNTPKSKQSFGKIKFKDHDEKTATFVRLNNKTKIKLKSINELWNSSWPTLLISVIGGRKHLQLDQQLKEVLGRGLVKAARVTDAWIISDGLHTGVSKCIGEAISDYKSTMDGKKKLVAIGIAPFECVQNKESLVNEEGVWPAEYDTTDDGNQETYALDPNYSHFLFVDNDTQETFGVESILNEKLIKRIAETKIPDIDVNIPAVTIMIGGGLRTLNSACDSISRNIPVVVVKNSGLAALVMEEAYETVSENENAQDINNTDGPIIEELKNIIKGRFTNEESLDDEEIEQLASSMLILKDRINLVSIYNNSGEDFDVAVLRAVLKENEIVRNMKLAIKWNRIDILKNRGVRPEDLQETEKRWFKENIKLRRANGEEATIPCDAFGEIMLEESSEKTSKFVRVDAETPMEIIIHLLTVVWDLPLPKLLISLLSGQEGLALHYSDEIEPGKSWFKAAKDIGAWILYPGLITPEMQYLMDITNRQIHRSDLNYEVVIIGIAPWNCVKNNESLLNNEGSWPARYYERDAYALDHRHSHFIFVDDGTPDTFGVETEFIRKLKQTITKMRIPGTRIKIPAVEVLVEGGLEILEIWDRFVDIPVVIVEGSGGTADFLVKAYQIVSENEDAKSKQKKLEDIIRKSFQEVNNLKSKDLKDMVKNLYISMMKSRLVTVYNVYLTETFDAIMLTAVMKTTNSATKKRKLAFEWNRIDILEGDKFLWNKNVKNWMNKNITIRASTPSDAFGEIIIQRRYWKRAKFVRVGHKTNMETMVCLTRFLWNLPLPNLLISVMGDKTYLEFNSSIQEDLGRVLVEVARTTGAWIISEGLQTGAAKIIGKAIYDANRETGNNEVVTIGIAPWNCVQNKKSLINEEGVWPAKYDAMDNCNEKTCLLDPNHSHFILVDNGTSRTFVTETKFKNQFKKTITEMDVPGTHTKIPAIAVMIGGGLGTLHASIKSILHDIPVIIVKGSGGAADVMADAYQTISKKLIQPKLQDIIRKRFTNEGENLNDDELKQLADSMLKLKNKINLVSVYKESAEDFDVAVLRAVIKAKKTELYQYNNENYEQISPVQAKNILELTLKWNRVDIAKREIIVEDFQWTDPIWNFCIQLALEEESVDFVKLFKEYGVNFTNTMRNIYDDETCYGITYEKCIIDLNKEYFLEEFISHTLYSTDDSEDFYSIIHFFLWAFLQGKYEAAFLIWTFTKDALPLALIVNKLLKSLEPKCKDYHKRIQLQEQADRYEKYAEGLLTECLNENQRKTVDLLLLQRKTWNDTSCMQVAFNVNNETFMSHNACQSVLNKIWMRKISEENTIWKLLLCTLCPFLIFLVKFDEETQTPREKTNNSSRRLNSGENMFCRCASFYKTPMIKFLSNLIFNIIFLGIYSYVLLVELQQKVSNLELLLIMWVIGIFTEEIHQLLTRSVMQTTCSLSFGSKCIKYIKSVWNIIDVFTIMVFTIGYILRLLNLDEIARVILCLNLISFYVRLLHMLSVHKNLGLKVVIIKKMMQDVGYFAIILLIFLTAFGIATQSILSPNTPVSFPEVFKTAYFHMYAELFLEEYEGSFSCDTNNSTCPTKVSAYTVSALMCIYVLLTNIILLNLLIAMFSSTYEAVQRASQLHWSFQRYDIICEFCIRPSFPPPFTLLSNIYQFCCYLHTKLKKEKGSKPETENPFSKELPSDKDYKDLIHWESQMVQSYVTKQNESDSKNKNLVDQLTLRLEESERQLKSVLYENSQKTAESSTKLYSRIDKLEESQQQLKTILYENSQKIAECSRNLTFKESYAKE